MGNTQIYQSSKQFLSSIGDKYQIDMYYFSFHLYFNTNISIMSLKKMIIAM